MGRSLLVFILSFLGATTAEAAIPGTAAPTIGLGVGGAVISPTSNIPLSNPTGAAGTNAVFSVYAGGGFTSGNIYHLYGGAGTAGSGSSQGQQFRVTTGKTAFCFNLSALSGTANGSYQLASFTATFADAAASGTGVGPVYQCGAKDTACNATGAAYTVTAMPGLYVFYSQTFPAINTTTTQTTNIVHLDCYEN